MKSLFGLPNCRIEGIAGLDCPIDRLPESLTIAMIGPLMVLDWRIGGLADWRIGGLADWRIGGLAD
jgi:hypothetical protein